MKIQRVKLKNKNFKDILNYGIKKKGPKQFKEFETKKTDKLNDITEKKFRLKLIDHYHRMLQKVKYFFKNSFLKIKIY